MTPKSGRTHTPKKGSVTALNTKRGERGGKGRGTGERGEGRGERREEQYRGFLTDLQKNVKKLVFVFA